jgi:hypothetical protein
MMDAAGDWRLPPNLDGATWSVDSKNREISRRAKTGTGIRFAVVSPIGHTGPQEGLEKRFN